MRLKNHDHHLHIDPKKASYLPGGVSCLGYQSQITSALGDIWHSLTWKGVSLFGGAGFIYNAGSIPVRARRIQSLNGK